jgi:quercetin dioxygenase-like cupin family protein
VNRDTIFPKGDRAPQEYFSNTAWVRMLHADESRSLDTQVYNVVFEAAARTYWHSHPGGQILLVTSGRGYYQEKGEPARLLEKGDVVAIPPDVVHWHGAAPDNEFVHIGLSSQVHLGPAEWSGPVKDSEYADATAE